MSPPPFQLMASEGEEGGTMESPTLESLALGRKGTFSGPNAGKPLQLAKSINDYADVTKAQNDPGTIPENDIKATDEYDTWLKAYVKVPYVYDEADVVLGCRLAIRDIQQKKSVNISLVGDHYLNMAHDQSSAADGAGALVGKLEWVPFNSGLAASDPAKLDSEFAKWLLVANTAEPNDKTGKMNCWELVMFGAYKAGIISANTLKSVYQQAVLNVQTKKYWSVGQTFEEYTKASSPVTYDLNSKDSPQPLRGDIVVLKDAPTHACVATGTQKTNSSTGRKEAEVYSLWTPNGKKAERTTIEALTQVGSSVPSPILFWSAKWR